MLGPRRLTEAGLKPKYTVWQTLLAVVVKKNGSLARKKYGPGNPEPYQKT